MIVKRIIVNNEVLDEEAEKAHQLQLEQYNVAIPETDCVGKMADQINQMAQTMFLLYEKTDEMISAINEMLKFVRVKTTEADEKTCQLYK